MYFLQPGTPVYARKPGLIARKPMFLIGDVGWLAKGLELRDPYLHVLFVGGQSSGWVSTGLLTVTALHDTINIGYDPKRHKTWVDDGPKTILDDIQAIRRGEVIWRGDTVITGYQPDAMLTPAGPISLGLYCRIARQSPQRLSQWIGL